MKLTIHKAPTMCQVLCCSSVPCHHIPSAYYVPGAMLFISVLLSYTKRLLCARHCAVSPVPCHHISLPLLKQVILSSLHRGGIYGLERLSNMAEELELMQTSCISSSLLLLPLASLCRYPGCVSWEFLLLCGKLYSPQEADLPSSLVLGLYSMHPLSFSFPFNPALLCGLGQGALGSHSLHFLLGLHGMMSGQPKQHWYFSLQLL